MAANTNEHDAIDDQHIPYDVDGFETLTESLGFESFSEKSKCDFDEEWLKPAEPRSAAKREGMIKCRAVTDLPPLLSSLNMSGRPRFNLVKIRENGRLKISSVRNTRPEVFVARTPPTADHGGRVRVKFIDAYSSSSSSSSGKSSILPKKDGETRKS